MEGCQNCFALPLRGSIPHSASPLSPRTVPGQAAPTLSLRHAMGFGMGRGIPNTVSPFHWGGEGGVSARVACPLPTPAQTHLSTQDLQANLIPVHQSLPAHRTLPLHTKPCQYTNPCLHPLSCTPNYLHAKPCPHTKLYLHTKPFLHTSLCLCTKPCPHTLPAHQTLPAQPTLPMLPMHVLTPPTHTSLPVCTPLTPGIARTPITYPPPPRHQDSSSPL